MVPQWSFSAHKHDTISAPGRQDTLLTGPLSMHKGRYKSRKGWSQPGVFGKAEIPSFPVVAVSLLFIHCPKVTVNHRMEKIGMDFCRGCPCQHPFKGIYPLSAGIPCQVPYTPLLMLPKIRPLPHPMQKWPPHSKTPANICPLQYPLQHFTLLSPARALSLQTSMINVLADYR